ncbi:MAG: thioredoxin family protein [Balneolaceae bacterium]|nr:thioredoxin family protein [Balneolaceae bacterium]
MFKQTLRLLTVLMLGFGLAAFVPLEEPANPKLELGAKAPLTDYEMQNVDGEMLSLSDVAGENGVLVVFSCNTCPWVERWEDRYNPVAGLAEENDIGVIFPNSNAAIRDGGESFQDMVQRARSSGYEFPYVLDEDARLASAFGATHTPDVFLFNGDMELVYKGAIDDNAASAEDVGQHYLRDAINALANGGEIGPKETKSLGCEIKFPES